MPENEVIHLVIEFRYDWYYTTKPQLKWLISLYDWSIFSILDAYAITGRVDYVEHFVVLRLVEALSEPTCSGDRLVRITEHGKRYLEDVYPIELLLKLLVRSSRRSTERDRGVSEAVDALVKRLPLGFAPMFLTHSDSNIREIGKTIVDQVN